MMAAHYLTHIYTYFIFLRQKKGQLISERVKGPLCATIRAPLMKALDGSVETLGLRIVTFQLLSVLCVIYFQVFVFVIVVVFSQLNKILLLEIIIERVAPYFSFVPNQ